MDGTNASGARFERINALYSDYAAFPAGGEAVSGRQGAKEKLVIEICSVFFLKASPAEKNRAEYEDYSAEIVACIHDCLKGYPVSGDAQNDISFSRYAYNAISRKLGTLKANDSVSRKNGGMGFSDAMYRKIKKVRTLDRNLMRIGIADESERNRRLAEALGIPAEDVLRLKGYDAAATAGLERRNDAGEAYSILDVLQDTDGGTAPAQNAETYIVQAEALHILLSAIQAEWERKPDAMLSELLTRDILGGLFPKRAAGKGTHDGQFAGGRRTSFAAEGCLNVPELLAEYRFFNAETVDADYVLPEAQQIARRYGVTKSAAAKKLARFYQKVRERDDVRGVRGK